MVIASNLRKTNIAEYLLYMWQVEDLIRANSLDIDRIKTTVIDRFDGLSDAQRAEMAGWYESLIDMMRREDLTETGHLQINRNVLAELVDLHKALLADARFSEYSALFYRTLPHIVELRSRGGKVPDDEISTCFTALYGMLLLRLQSKDISPQTADAVKQISQFIAALGAYYIKNEREPLFAPKD